MATTKEDISVWFDEARREGATHLLVVCDEFDYEEAPFDASGAAKSMGHHDYCWMNAAYVMGARMTDAFAKTGFCVAIRGAEGGEVAGNVARPAGDVSVLGGADDGNRGFRRDAIDGAPDARVKDRVAKYKNGETAELGKEFFHWF